MPLLSTLLMFGVARQSGWWKFVWRRAGLTIVPVILTVSRLTAVGGQSVTLAWAPPPDTGVSGYMLYYGTNSGDFKYRLDVGTNTAASVPGLNEGRTYFFTVTAYNAAMVESEPSNEVRYLVPSAIRMIAGATPDAPVRLSFTMATGYHYAIQATEDFESWVTIWETTAKSDCSVEVTDPEAASHPMRFYRSVYY